jgi:hypothetical protein
LFSRNDDYSGGVTLEQDPACTSQPHVTYKLGNGIWAALSGMFDYGGQTTLAGVQNDDLQGNSRVGATLALPVNRNNSIKLYASTGTHARTGSDYDLLQLVWQYRWGHGL